MGEVETSTNYSPSTAKRPSPSSVAEVLGIVQLQQQTSSPPTNRKGFNNPLPAIGKSANEPTHGRDTLTPKGLSRSFPSPRSLGNDDHGFENAKSPRTDAGVLSTPRGGKRPGATGSVQGRKDVNQLPPISSAPNESPKLERSKTTLTRTYSGGETRPRSNSNPRPRSARGIRTRSFHGEASHQRIMAQNSSDNATLRSRQIVTKDNAGRSTSGQHVLLTQRRSVGSRGGTSSMPQDTRTHMRPSNPSPSDCEGLERPSAPSPPSPRLDSDSESDTELDQYVANLHVR